jgi:hypothetical protein
MEAINDSTKLIAQAIGLLDTLNYATVEDEDTTLKAVELLKTALDKLVEEIK